MVKIYTTVTDRYAPLHQTVIAGTAGEAIHALDGLFGHSSGVNVDALHVDDGGVSDIVFATMALLGLDFEPRIPRLSDRRLYAFEPAKRYGRLAPVFGRRLDRDLIVAAWPDIEPVVAALRQTVTAELNKGEAQNALARAVAFHRLGRFRDRGLDNQQTRAAALNLVAAAIILFNCRYLGAAVEELRRRGKSIDPNMLGRLSPLGWDRINLTGDYVGSQRLDLDEAGLMPLLAKPNREPVSE